MAKIKKEQEEEIKNNEYDFILPLEMHELRKMWEEYTDGKKIINFYSSVNRLCLAEYVYYNRKQVVSYNETTGMWSSYIPSGESFSDFKYKDEKARRNWKQFEEYARKREYAIKQGEKYDLYLETSLPEAQTFISFNDF